MHKFYTYCNVLSNSILLKGYENGKKITEKIPFSPTFYIQSKNKSKWHSLYDNKPLEPITFDSIREARDFKEQYKDVVGFDIHGMDKYQYQYIHENYPGTIEYDLNLVTSLTFDIEVISDDGFPDIQEAAHPITLISLHNSSTETTLVLGLKPYNVDENDTFEYIQFNSEKALLRYFIEYNIIHKPDIWTGWNTSEFDIPYIVNRIMNIFGEELVKKLSPFNYIREKTILVRGREIQTYDIFGIVDLDYLQLYKKFGTYSAKESYALGFIAQEELGETKLTLPGENFKDSYDNHFDIFVRYNAIDTILVKKFEKKMKLIELAFSLAYIYKCNLSDIYKTVVPWEIFIYNHLAEKKIAVPPRKKTIDSQFEGAWVKETIPGMYGWLMSFDFASLYPSIIRQWNISPETFISDYHAVTVKDFLEETEEMKQVCAYAKQNNYAVAANGSLYKKEKTGFLAELMEFAMEGRKLAKKEMLMIESQYEKTKNDSLKPKIAALHNRQMALKIAANAAYGAIGNKGFLYYEYRMAEAITLTGQLSDIHLANSLNKRMNVIMDSGEVNVIASAILYS